MSLNPPSSENLELLRDKLGRIRAEALQLEAEIAARETDRQLGFTSALDSGEPASNADAPPVTPEAKVALFLKLFATRRSVFPKLWENPKTGRMGYSPVCNNEWRTGICQKPRVKCSECLHQKFPPLDERAVEAHLRGKHTLGVYAIAVDNTCRFLAADFDGEGWRGDVVAYRDAAARSGITVAVERSRSGNGAHAWMFFTESVPAALARRLGLLLIARASAARPALGLAAYDRLFPNQDTLPAGGFGNLIALPLAREPRQKGNTVFLDTSLEPTTDQWAYLGKLPRLRRQELETIVARLSPQAPLAALAASTQTAAGQTREPDRDGESDGETALALRHDEALLDISHAPVRAGLVTGEITVRLDAGIHLPRTLPTALLAALRRLATLANPEFHEKLRLRFATYDTPRFLFAGEWHPDRLVLPRGVLVKSLALLEQAGATVVLQDARTPGARIPWTFTGELRPEQTLAVKTIAAHDTGVLCAPPGAGKTVMGCALIAQTRVSALVLVHRSVLLDQWREAAMRFLGLKRKEIGVWRGKAPRLTQRLDIAMLPSVARAEDFAAVFSNYGLVIVDECHHLPAATFEGVLKACASRRVYGLTATPARKDRLEKLMFFQCGPIRHTLGNTPSKVTRTVRIRRTSFTLPNGVGGNEPRPPIHEVWQALVADEGRSDLIVAELLDCGRAGRSPLVLADRTAYLDTLEGKFAARAPQTTHYRLDGSIGKKARRLVLDAITQHYATGTPFVVFASASLVGEGLDIPRLDTLFLTMPLSFKGRLVQYAGRLHRSHEAKTTVLIHDYLDATPLTQAMFRRRSAAYGKMGYIIEDPESEPSTDEPAQLL
ncbi:MAG: DEAD/DEAH box helicase family protein [Opitutus sp.]|nr:DEAD/DEAH box helicase family protein [Opitutus sp.]MCS6248119.1 DEAD/DEAH box helicase family protein [Opitutus sp.]MCS6274825.1 DEAD/DEAH box helicase family protein [Opitutus sp.]MCS6275850.1 DEAD/DEAH box helicase family protein [Opitutus sp.]MCS6300946.1 DEAD/DEAH box helicase family protein [Opitutus sp.]